MRTRPTATRKFRDAGELQALREWLREELSARADERCVADVVVAVQEAVTNSLRSRGPGRRPVAVHLDLDDGYVWVEVVDSGPGLADADTVGPRPSTDAVNGRGLYLMRSLMDVLEISSYPAGSRVRMGKRLGVDGSMREEGASG
jgi:anti-sigma regulatory factor (Ser/Thr protein kinase)